MRTRGIRAPSHRRLAAALATASSSLVDGTCKAQVDQRRRRLLLLLGRQSHGGGTTCLDGAATAKRHHEIGWLDVSMGDAVRREMTKGRRCLQRDLQGRLPVRPAIRSALGLSNDKLHHEKVSLATLTPTKTSDEIGMRRQVTRELCLPHETRRRLVVEHLHGHLAVGVILRSVHVARRASSNLADILYPSTAGYA